MARLKTRAEFHLTDGLMARLARVAGEEGRKVDELVQDALGGYLRMVEDVGLVPEGWRAVPIEVGTSGILKDFTAELGDNDTLHLETAVAIYFHDAARGKRGVGHF